jgi:branched-chain amino acid transport system permease protein
MMLGAVLCFTFWVTLGWPLALAVLLALMACALWGVVVERVAVRPFVARGSNSWLIATVALGIVLENVVLFTFGKDPRGTPPGILTTGDDLHRRRQDPIPSAAHSGDRARAGRRSAIVLCNIAARQRAAGGGPKQGRGPADGHPGRARDRAFAFALSGLLAGIAGILVAPLFIISSTMGTLFGIKAFAVAILGGIESAWGVVLAGLLYGIAEALITALVGSTYTQIVTFALVILALALRPNGLFGRAELRKV